MRNAQGCPQCTAAAPKHVSRSSVRRVVRHFAKREVLYSLVLPKALTAACAPGVLAAVRATKLKEELAAAFSKLREEHSGVDQLSEDFQRPHPL